MHNLVDVLKEMRFSEIDKPDSQELLVKAFDQVLEIINLVKDQDNIKPLLKVSNKEDTYVVFISNYAGKILEITSSASDIEEWTRQTNYIGSYIKLD